MQPFFTIITPSLNEEHYLPILLDRLAKQTFKNFEVIHVDGNSEDKTVRLAKSFAKKLKIKSIIVKKRNVCFQRNMGAKNAMGKWLIFIDADDQISPIFLQEIYDYVNNHNINLLSTFYKPDTDKLIHKLLATFMNYLSYLLQFTKMPFITESVFIIKKIDFIKLGGFNENLKASEGTELVKKAKQQNLVYKIIKKPKYTFSMRRVESQGVINTIKKNAIIGLKMILGKQITKKNIGNLYPMKGGEQYKKTKNS